MSGREKRLKSIESELQEMYLDLFGSQYVPGLQDSDKNEFSSIISRFRQSIFFIRQTQQEREKKEKKKNFKQSAEQIHINQALREEIIKAQQILQEGLKRVNTNLKGKSEEATKKILMSREKEIKNCFQMLKDVKEIEEGETYKPPNPPQTLDQIKKQLVRGEQEGQKIDLREEEAIEEIKKNDENIEKMLDEVIDINQKIKNGAIKANQALDHIQEQVSKNIIKTDLVSAKIKKGQSDLAEVLKNYRRPNKLCLDITLVLLFIALIGVIINMIKSGAV